MLTEMLPGVSPVLLDKTPHFEVWEDADARLLVLRRSSLALESECDIPDVIAMLDRCFCPSRAKHGLLVDMRAVVGRADDRYTALTAPLRALVVQRYPRHAVLVRSAVGKLQARRISQSDSNSFIVVTDAEEAVQTALSLRG